MVIKDPSAFPPGYADWFMQYQANHSWGLDGCRSIEAFEEGLKALPDAVHQDLKRLGLYNLDNRFPGENREQEIFQRFLKTRFINHKGNKVLMPVIELVNHAPAAKGFNQGGDGIAVGGVHVKGDVRQRVGGAVLFGRALAVRCIVNAHHVFNARLEVEARWADRICVFEEFFPNDAIIPRI
mgnify:CR=1 FL=1